MHANIRNNEILDFNSMYLDKDITRVETNQQMYELYKNDNRSVVYQDGEIVENQKYPAIKLSELKQTKIAENDRLRDEKLNSGVVYSGVLFDSDTDQKVNLLAKYNTMADEDTIVWYGKNNDGLLCSKPDLLAIGGLISQLHSYCWEMNSLIKEQIYEADNTDSVLAVSLEY